MIRHSFILGLFTLVFSALYLGSVVNASYERAIRIKALDVLEFKDNFVLFNHKGDDWLIHHKQGCGDIKEGQSLILVIRGELDGNRDFLRRGSEYDCIVDQAEMINGKMTVTRLSGSTDFTTVNYKGVSYVIHYSQRCADIANMKGKEIYIQKYGFHADLRAGDRFFLPAADEACTITNSQLAAVEPRPKPPSHIDIKHPSTPTNLVAVPRRISVELHWRAPADGDVAYYIINASRWHMDDPVVQDTSEQPQKLYDTIQTPTNKNYYEIKDLNPDERYFFRVIAVDTSGNKSSYWSNEATAFTRSSASQANLNTPVLKIFKLQETKDSFLFRWTDVPGSAYSIILEVDGERVLATSRWPQKYIKIFKTPERKGKIMKLTVRSLTIREVSQKAVYEFSF